MHPCIGVEQSSFTCAGILVWCNFALSYDTYFDLPYCPVLLSGLNLNGSNLLAATITTAYKINLFQ